MVLKGALLDELAMLRQKNAELELQLGKRGGAAVADVEGDNSQPADSALDSSLKTRGSGRQHFKIRSWDMERMGRGRATSPDDSTMALVPFEADSAGRASSSAGRQVVTQDALSLAAVSPQTGLSSQHWIVQPKLIMQTPTYGSGVHCSAHDQFRSMATELASASSEVVTSRIAEVYAKHLEDSDRPHLAFSAGIPTLFSLLQDAEVAAGSPASTTPPGQDSDREAFFRCAAVLRQLMDSSRFRKTPPRRRPDDIARPAYVRELCALAGLCLDLVRLGFVHKKRLRNNSARTEKLALEEAGRQEKNGAQDVEKKRVSAEVEELCVEREESRDILALAGKLLTAIQMDMDRVHDEASAQARKMKAEKMVGDPLSWFPMPEEKQDKMDESVQPEEKEGKKGVPIEPGHNAKRVELTPPPSPGSPVSPNTRAKRAECDRLLQCAIGMARPLRKLTREGSVVSPVEATNTVEEVGSGHVEEIGTVEEIGQGHVDEPSQVVPVPDKAHKTRVLAVVPSATPSDDSRLGTPGDDPPSRASSVAATRAASPAASGDPSAVDPLLTPTFGDFLEQQLLPLYIADVPFETLKHLSETCCGIPLDSDDERKAWKLLGMQMPQRAAAKKLPAKAASGGWQLSPSAASATSPASTLATPPKEEAGPSLAALMEKAMEKQAKGSMGPPRQQMNTSVVERRGKELTAPRDMETAVFQRSRSQRSIMNWPSASPLIKPSSALLATPNEFAALRGLSTSCAPSPVSMRKTSRGRMELQSSVQSTASMRRHQARARSRSPCPASAVTPNVRNKTSVSQPDWHLLDTPAR